MTTTATTTSTAHALNASARDRSRQHRLDPMRGIFVSLGLGAAGWLVVASLALVLRALLS